MLVFKNDDKLFAVCPEMHSQVGKKDENVELDVLTKKFAEFDFPTLVSSQYFS